MKRIFIAGLAAIVPVAITVYVVILLVSFANDVIGVRFNKFLDAYLPYNIPDVLGILVGILTTIVLIFLIGLIVQLSRMRLSRWIEQMFFKWPLVDKIYFPIKRIVNFLFFPPRKTFKSVVLVEYPRRGIYAIGFITTESSVIFNSKTGKKLYNVFISSSPSPLTGFTILVEESELLFLDISVESAIKLVVSGGLLNPED